MKNEEQRNEKGKKEMLNIECRILNVEVKTIAWLPFINAVS
jgi:hypothetical protein